MSRTVRPVRFNNPLRHRSWGRLYRALALLGCFAVSACGVNTVTVSGSYPTPVVEKIPLSLGVYFGEEFQDYIYTEYTERGKEEYRVLSGPSHVELFRSVLPAMFDRVVVLNTPEAAGAEGVDLIFAPAIEEFQLALPQKTRLDSYEVWIKYNMRVTDRDGGHVADWVQTAYGKTPTEGFSSAESGINNATLNALRDLGTSFSMSFARVPDVRDWLNSH